MSWDENEAIAAAAQDHPPADELVDYAGGELAPEPAQRLHGHLERCRECRELVGDLTAYPDLEPPGDAYRVDEQEMRHTLGTLRTRLLDSRNRRPEEPGEPDRPAAEAREAEEAPAKLLRFRPASAAGRSPAPWWSWAAAAVIVLSLGWGLSRQLELSRLESAVENLGSRLSEAEAALRQPRANAAVVGLPATDDPLRSPEVPAVSPGDAGVTLVIQPDEPLPPGEWAAEIRGPDGTTVLRIAGLRPQAVGVTFYLPPKSLPAGEYRVWLTRDGATVWPTTFELAVAE
ncbi:MAG: zf-HC2 domain-containing protein [bacterium]|nr:zf-HC2 domain-containing protein [bacterium]